jgi:SAM-dependent methyltransferase
LIFFPNKKIRYFTKIKELFFDKDGIEIGGPSSIFRSEGYIPIYDLVRNLDGCNYSNNTIWEGTIRHQGRYIYNNTNFGIQFVFEATKLTSIPNEKYDFVISSNCLEHIANPLKAIQEWTRILKPGGLLLLVVPNKEYCFDHGRPDTEFEHILKDYNNSVGEDDLTHLEEILNMHDLEMDKPAGNISEFRSSSLNNFDNRTLHHHVFNLKVLKQILLYFNYEVLYTLGNLENIILARKIW